MTTHTHAGRRRDRRAARGDPRHRVRPRRRGLRRRPQDLERDVRRRPARRSSCAARARPTSCAAIEFARSEGLEIAVRGGSHSIPGFSTTEGIVIDLSMMKGARVDPGTRRVVAQPGLLWQDLDAETQAFGLAATGGLISTTGVSGFTLGGGIGWLVRKQGLACDHLVSADVVTADGRLVRARRRRRPRAPLGAARWRRQLRRRHRAGARAPAGGPDGLRRDHGLRRRARRRRRLLLRRLDGGRPARRADDDPQPDDRAAGAVPARVHPRQAGRDRRRLLRRPRRRGRARARARPRPGRPCGRPAAARCPTPRCSSCSTRCGAAAPATT